MSSATIGCSRRRLRVLSHEPEAVVALVGGAGGSSALPVGLGLAGARGTGAARATDLGPARTFTTRMATISSMPCQLEMPGPRAAQRLPGARRSRRRRPALSDSESGAAHCKLELRCRQSLPVSLASPPLMLSHGRGSPCPQPAFGAQRPGPQDSRSLTRSSQVTTR